MGLQGNLRTMVLPDVLQWLSQGRKTGILHVLGVQGVAKRIYFEDGAIVSTASSDPREYLGQFLISRGFLTEEQLIKAMETQLQTGIMLGRVLLTVGLIEERDLEAMLRLKARENVYDLFLWDEGDFTFQDMRALEADIPRVHLDVTSITMEGIRRKDEWARIGLAFPDDRVVLGRTGRPLDPGRCPDGSVQGRVWAVLDGHRSLAEASLELHMTPFQLAEAAYHLYRDGLLQVTGQKARPEERTYADIQNGFREEASRALKGARFKEAANLYRYLVRVHPDDDEAREGLAQAEEALAQDYFQDVVPLGTVLELAVPLEKLALQDLTPQEGYLASRVNGSWDISSILKVSPLSQREALKAIRKLLDRGILRPKLR